MAAVGKLEERRMAGQAALQSLYRTIAKKQEAKEAPEKAELADAANALKQVLERESAQARVDLFLQEADSWKPGSPALSEFVRKFERLAGDLLIQDFVSELPESFDVANYYEVRRLYWAGRLRELQRQVEGG